MASADQHLARRLTYRTARVIQAVAQEPGASNRRIAQLAEIKDEGQTSKLLHRLAAQGYLRKKAGAAGKPNAWYLTAQGRRLEEPAAQRVAEAAGRGRGGSRRGR
jgi:DNA-binding MarR family transcriptional regulator